MEHPGGKKEEKKTLNFLRSNSREKELNSQYNPENAVLPRRFRGRLHYLFEQIEAEFGTMYAENAELRRTITEMNEKLNTLESPQISCDKNEPNHSNGSESQKLVKGKSGSSQLSQRLKTTYKTSTSKLVSSFKPTASATCRVAQEFRGHKDGIWDVDSSQVNSEVIGSASADQKAKLWNIVTGQCIGTYHGHLGSVNCIRFHPSKQIALTVSGDSSAHLWSYDVIRSSSCDEDATERDDVADVDSLITSESRDYRDALIRSACHTSPVVGCDWLMEGQHFVTASWDRTACLVDCSTNQIVQTLSGHDLPLTYVSAHPKHKVIVTSSRDATFRVCDFRVPTVHTVIVGQGHSQSVSAATFTSDDKVVSSSDDRCVKVWELRSMRAPLASVRFDSPVNRISVSRRGVIAIPHDNRQIRLYDTSGSRLARLPRNDRASHRRVVTAATWVENSCSSVLTCGWDKIMINWNVEFPHSSISQR